MFKRRSVAALVSALALVLCVQSAGYSTNFSGASGNTGCALINMADGRHLQCLERDDVDARK